MGQAINRLDFILSGVLRVVFYRSLHMVSVPFTPHAILNYALEHTSGQGHFGGRVEEIHRGLLTTIWIWRDINLGTDLKMDMYFFGFNHGAQTVLVRTGFWKGNFSLQTIRATL